MKAKPTKWGIKIFVLSDATNGYTYRLQIHTGKDMESETNIGLCSRVVLDFMSGLEAHGFHLFTDNCYISPQLSLTPYKKGVNTQAQEGQIGKDLQKILSKLRWKTARLS